MDFLVTARLLMDLRQEHPLTRYEFDNYGNVVITIPIEDNVPDLFDSAAKMFEPVY